MNHQNFLSQSRGKVQSFNLLKLAIQTAKADRNRYLPRQRQLSMGRLPYFLIPNLKKPIFIVGAPRSGTTFLGSCLAALPEISYHFEPVATKAAARHIYQGDWGKIQGKLFYRAVYGWLMCKYGDGDLRFAEKTPRNCFILDFLLQTFPDAKFIHIIRDGRDAALSYSKKPWLQASQAKSGLKEPGGYYFGPYARFWVELERVKEFESTSDIHRCIWAWRRHTTSALTASSRIPNHQYHEIRYETLVTNPATVAEEILNFLAISDSFSCEKFQQKVACAKPDSVAQWQKELSLKQLAKIEEEAGDLLRQLGYE